MGKSSCDTFSLYFSMACFIGKIKSSSLSLNDLHCCSPAEPVTSDLFYGRIKAKLTSYRRLLANYSQMKKRFVCFLPKAMWGLKLSSKKREKKTACIFKDYFTLACLFQSAPSPLNSQECINKQTKGLCAEYSLHGKTSPQWLTCQLTLN